MRKKSIGVIGLGTMGAPMAANLLRKGYAVIVYNRTPGKTDAFAQLGAEIAGSPLDAVRKSDTIVTMVSNDNAIREVYYGEQGIIQGVRPGQTIIDCSTISPDLTRQLAADIKAKSGDFLDAPVTGSKPAAEEGTLVFMVGGSSEAIRDNEQVFLAMGRKVLRMGDNGSGSTAKLAHNTVVAINLVGLIEGMSIAAAGGIDAAAFLELIQSGGAASKQADLKGRKIIEQDYSNQFSLALMLKDLRLSSVLSDGMGVPTPMLEAAKGQFQIGDAMGCGDLDMSGLAQCYERWIGRPIAGNALYGKADAPEALKEEAGTASGADASAPERRRSARLSLDIPLMLSVYQWKQKGGFFEQSIAATLLDLSEGGLQIATSFPLEKDMFVVIHFMQEAGLPPITARIIRIEPKEDIFHYGCMLTGLPPYQKVQLEQYIDSKIQSAR
ncbi:NAD(P)-binding domain-containing protein [Paenibacillus tarimensis]